MAQPINADFSTWINRLLDEHPLLLSLVMGGMFILILVWFSQPIEMLYDPHAPPAYEKWDPNR